MTKNTLNPTIELIKFVSAIAVVAIHYTQIMAKLGIELETYEELIFMARFAVPIFFIISGYLFSFNSKSVYLNLKCYFIVFGIYSLIIMPALPYSTYSVIWFLSVLATIQIIHIVLRKLPIEWIFVVGIMTYVFITRVFYFEVAYSWDDPVITSISMAILMLPLFSFGILVKKRNLKISKLGNTMLVATIIMLFLNSQTLQKGQTSLFQFIMAGILFLTTYHRFFNLSEKLIKVTKTSFEVYIFHYMILGLICPYFVNVLSGIESTSAFILVYLLFFLATTLTVTVFSIALQKTRITENLLR